MSEAVFAACACGAGEGDVSAGDRLAAAAAGTGSLPDGQVSGQRRRREVSGNTAQSSAQWRLARDAAAVACAMTSHVPPRAASLRLTVTAHARGLWLHLAYCQPGPPAGSPWFAAAAGRLALIDAPRRGMR